MFSGTVIESKTEVGVRLPMGATLEIQRQQRLEQIEQQMIWAQMQAAPRRRVSNKYNPTSLMHANDYIHVRS